jgi:actin-related protein 8
MRFCSPWPQTDVL